MLLINKILCPFGLFKKNKNKKYTCSGVSFSVSFSILPINDQQKKNTYICHNSFDKVKICFNLCDICNNNM